MAAGQYARGSLGYNLQPNYEILEEIYDDSYEPTQEGKNRNEKREEETKERERVWRTVATSNK